MHLTILLCFLASCSCGTKEKAEMDQNKQTELNEVIELGENHWQTYTEIIINAPADRVWKTLADWDNIKTWSSTLKGIEGERKNNGKVIVSYLVDGKTYETSHNFIFEEGNEFGWSDPMVGSFRGLTDNHKFRVEKVSKSQTRFIQSDDFRGEGNQNISAKDVANQTISFFPLFNKELKREVESRIEE